MFGLADRFQKAIYRFVETRSSKKIAIKKSESAHEVAEYVANNVFNWKHADGRIHASSSPDKYYAVSASVYHPEFRSQVEDGVWPIVHELVQKNYLPLSSCEGHHWTRLFVCVAFGSKGQAEQFAATLKKEIKAIGFFVRVMENYLNQKSSIAAGQLYQTKLLDRSDSQKEAVHLNKLFLRSYEKYYFVEFGLFEFKSDDLFFNYYMNFLKYVFGRKAYQKLISYFQSGLLKSIE